MVTSLNSVQLIGHVGRDPDVRTFQNGGKVANLRLATSERWRDKNTGETRERTEWHSIAVFSEGLVKIVEQYIKKGAYLHIVGKLQTRKWQDQSGNDRYSTEIVLQGYDAKLGFLDKRQGGSSPSGDSQSGSSYGDGSSGGLDDEIPF